MTQASEVQPLTAIVHPVSGRVVDIVSVSTSAGVVELRDLGGDTFELNEDVPVRVLAQVDRPVVMTQVEHTINWAATLSVLLSLFGLVGLLVLVAVLGSS